MRSPAVRSMVLVLALFLAAASLPLFGWGPVDRARADTTGCSLGPGVHSLVDFEAETQALSPDADASCEFFVRPAETASFLRFTVDFLSGDVDLFVKRGSVPSPTDFDCASSHPGTSPEVCEGEVFADGVFIFALVRRASPGTLPVSFTITPTSQSACSLGAGVNPLGDEVDTMASLTSDVGAKCYFEFAAAAADFADFRLSLPASDFDLYVRQGALPTSTDFECRPGLAGAATESCRFLVEDPAAYQVMVRRVSGGGDFTVRADAVMIPILSTGKPVLGAVATGQFAYWKVLRTPATGHLSIAVVGDAAGAACHVAPCLPGTPNVDLYVRERSDPRPPRGLPTLDLFTCASATAGTLESCTFDSELHQLIGNPGAPLVTLADPGAGTLYIGVYGYVASSFTLTAANN